MRVKVYISKAAAIREGSESYGQLEGEVKVADLTQRQRESLASLSDFESLHLLGGTVSEAAISAALDALADKREAERATEAAEVEAAVQELLALPDFEFQTCSQYYSHAQNRALADPRLAERVAARKAWRLAEGKRITAEREEARRREEAEAASEREEELRQSALRLEQIAVWVRDRGTPNQQARYAAGLLPEAEVLAAIEEKAFAPLAPFSRYELLRASDVCTCDRDRYGDRDNYCHVDFSSEGVSEATAEEWDAAQAILAAIDPTHPEAEVVIREHTGRSRDCDQTVTRRSIRVTVTVGVLKFSQEYAGAESVAPY